MVGDHGRMMIRFNTAKHSDQAAGTGFSVTVEAVESGMCKIKRIWPGQFQNMQNIVLKIINNHQHPTIILEIFTAAQQCYMIITSLDGYYILSHVQIVSAI